jgi:hypothetical protein
MTQVLRLMPAAGAADSAKDAAQRGEELRGPLADGAGSGADGKIVTSESFMHDGHALQRFFGMKGRYWLRAILHRCQIC